MSLSDFLAEDPEDWQPDSFSVNEENRIWALRKLAKARREIADIEAQAAEEHAKITDWAVRASRRPDETVKFFENALTHHMMQLRAEGQKSLILPDGEITSRSVAARSEIQDRELFIKWCLDNGHYDWVREKREPNMEALRADVTVTGDTVIDTATGEVVEGVVGVVSQVKVTIRTER